MDPLDEVQGKVKEMVGRVVGDEELRADGAAQTQDAAAEREAGEAQAAAGEDDGRPDVFERMDRTREGL